MKKNLLKNIFSMVSLKGLEYLLALAILPYLVRVLGVEKYGTIVFMQSIIQYFVIIIDYGFNSFIIVFIYIFKNSRNFF